MGYFKVECDGMYVLVLVVKVLYGMMVFICFDIVMNVVFYMKKVVIIVIWYNLVCR